MIRLLQKDTDVNSANGFWQTTTGILSLSSSDLNDRPQFESVTQHRGARDTYGDNLRSNEGEGSLGDDAPPSDKPSGGSGNVVVLNEWTGVFPVTETDSETNVRISNTPGAKSSCLS